MQGRDADLDAYSAFALTLGEQQAGLDSVAESRLGRLLKGEQRAHPQLKRAARACRLQADLPLQHHHPSIPSLSLVSRSTFACSRLSPISSKSATRSSAIGVSLWWRKRSEASIPPGTQK